ncbi:hypothetical protein WFJ45_23080, partial [Salmonella enterica subsp. enterica serovar Minnesota]|uniref:hypothetical protein n=1 Tax=Salmonella enterica TaxID=28901 RepID=UPI003D29397D
MGYGLFILDAASRQYLLQKIETVSSALTRGAAWVTLWENLQASRVDPSAFMDTGLRALSHED